MACPECKSNYVVKKMDGYICGVCRTVLYTHPNTPVINCEWEEVDENTIINTRNKADNKREGRRRMCPK